MEYRSPAHKMRADARASSPIKYVGGASSALVIRYNDPNSVPENSYIVNRRYLQTNYAQYLIVYEGRAFRVYSPFLMEEITPLRISRVYDAGEDEMLTTF